MIFGWQIYSTHIDSLVSSIDWIRNALGSAAIFEYQQPIFPHQLWLRWQRWSHPLCTTNANTPYQKIHQRRCMHSIVADCRLPNANQHSVRLTANVICVRSKCVWRRQQWLACDSWHIHATMSPQRRWLDALSMRTTVSATETQPHLYYRIHLMFQFNYCHE